MMHHFEDEIRARYEHEPEFLQAHEEIAESLQALFDEEPRYLDLFKYLSEPDRIVSFRVAWRDDQGALQINRGYRVQFSNALGPYKGGLRFHPTVNVSLLKFLGLEQTLKNALTGLCLGGGKGGSDFDPKGKSDNEVRAFCYAFMTELRRHIGPNTDVPAGDIGVGSREIGYLFGCYKRLQNVQCGVITGKGPDWGGSYLRPEATGYGAVYFAEAAAKHFDLGPLRGKSCVVSGAGNAAQYTCEKLIELGAKVISVSDSKGTLLYKDGMTQEDLAEVMHHKNTIRAPLGELDTSNTYVAGQQPWDCVDTVDFAFPCACQNEISGAQAKRMVSNGVRLMVEVANMPLTADAHACLKEGGVLICPSKAANSGGVAVSGLEMAQNGCWTQWEKSKVDDMLKDIMASVFDKCLDAARRYSEERDLDTGANVAGFLRVAKAMTDQGFF